MDSECADGDAGSGASGNAARGGDWGSGNWGGGGDSSHCQRVQSPRIANDRKLWHLARAMPGVAPVVNERLEAAHAIASAARDDPERRGQAALANREQPQK